MILRKFDFCLNQNKYKFQDKIDKKKKENEYNSWQIFKTFF